ncbi:MAG: O-antigen ligase family protein [Ruminococcaceae bacterium]|nr:O-antigen ligase family protein [Oscillospiraceae bacterium]
MNKNKNMKISAHCILACLYFLLLPTTIAVNSSGNSYLKLAAIPIAVYFVITILLSKKTLQFNAVHLFLCIYTISTIIPFLLTPEISSIDFGYLLNTALYLCITIVKYNERELKLLEDIQVVLLFMLVVITLLSNGLSSDRRTLEIFGQTSDPNYFVGFFIFPLAVTMKKIFQSKYRLLYVILVFLSIYCVFMSGSRGGLIAVIATFAAFAAIYPTKPKSKLIILLTGGAFVLLSWLVIAPLLPENIIARMSIKQVVETGGTGRIEIWGSMLNEIVHSPAHLLCGRGLNTMHEMFIGGRWSTAVAHNQIIQVLYSQGIVGLIAYILLLCSCLVRCMRRRKTVAIAIIGMIAISMSLSFNATTRTFWNLVAYAAINFSDSKYHMNIENNKIPEENQ